MSAEGARSSYGRRRPRQHAKGAFLENLDDHIAIVALTVAFGATVAAARPATHTKHATATTTSAAFAKQLATLRAATAKYVNNLALAKHDGYGIITKMIPDVGTTT